jgi:hypothetical protein
LADEYNFDKFFEASAKVGFNTGEIFREAAQELYLEYKRIESSHYKSNESTGTTNSFKLKQRQVTDEGKTVEGTRAINSGFGCAC